MTPRLAFALDAAWSGAKSTLALFQNAATVELKQDQSPVTLADKECERIIRSLIEKAYPGEAVLGEEEGLSGAGDSRWVIDPIDGTKSFVAGVPLYGTLLSYEVEGQPVAGVCVFPALNEVVYAERGGGAFWNGRPCRVSQQSELNRSTLCHAGHKGINGYGHTEGLSRLAPQLMATRTWCDAYGHALVATGRAEGMFDPIVTRWDISAMVLIVEEAGGKATRLDGRSALEPWHANGEHQMLTSNGLLHDLFREELTP